MPPGLLCPRFEPRSCGPAWTVASRPSTTSPRTPVSGTGTVACGTVCGSDDGEVAACAVLE